MCVAFAVVQGPMLRRAPCLVSCSAVAISNLTCCKQRPLHFYVEWDFTIMSLVLPNRAGVNPPGESTGSLWRFQDIPNSVTDAAFFFFFFHYLEALLTPELVPCPRECARLNHIQ